MNHHQMTNDQIADIHRLIDKVAEETDGKYQANTLIQPYNPDEWIECPSETEFNEDGSPVIYLDPSENALVCKRIEVTTNPMSVAEYLLKIAKKKNHNYFESSEPFKPRVKRRAKKAKVRKQKKKW